MKIKLRKSVIFLLSVTVLAPIVLYTNTLGAYLASSSSRNEFVEDVSTFTFAGEVRPLNVLPQESSAALKEPLGVVYSENLADSGSKGSSVSSGENAHITRQLAEEDGISSLSNLSSGQNTIRQVIDQVHEVALEKKEENSREAELIGKVNEVEQNKAKTEIGSRRSKARSERLSERIVKFLSTAGASLIERDPTQPDDKQCGYFVMRFMRDIIEGSRNTAASTFHLSSLFKGVTTYSQNQLNEVREEWARCLIKNALAG